MFVLIKVIEMNRTFFSTFSVILIVFSLLIAACKKNETPQPQPPTPPTVPVAFVDQKVTASLQGKVFDENNKPIVNAKITAGNNTTTTDTSGGFRFNNIQLGKTAAFVSVEKDGFFKSGRTFMANAGTVNYVEVLLTSKKNVKTFLSSSGGEVDIDGGASVSFSANSIAEATTGVNYTGTVTVKSTYLDPSKPEFPDVMPGNLTGLDSLNKLSLINTLGIAVIELEGETGQKLNIAPGKTATIKLPIPANTPANTLSKIPLWYFNDSTGLWKKQGLAMKQGNSYVGEVSHFTFWTGDYPWDVGNQVDPTKYVFVKMNIKDQNNFPLQFYKLNLYYVNFFHTTGFTDSTGFISIMIPENTELQIKIATKCGEEFFSGDFGPFTTDADLGTIKTDPPVGGNITISGIALNCNQDTIVNGVADMQLEGVSYQAAVINGKFSLDIKRCYNTSSDLTITATDLITKQQSPVATINVTSGKYDAGNMIVACPPINDDFMNVRMNDTTLVGLTLSNGSLNGYISPYSTIVDGVRKDVSPVPLFRTFIQFDTGKVLGMRNISSLIITNNGELYTKQAAIPIQITEYGSKIGEYISGNFSGTLKDSLTSTKTMKVDCNFKVKITQIQ